MDKIDTYILEILSEDSNVTMQELAKKVGLSVSPCHLRVKKLEKNGFIKGYKAILDYTKLNQSHVAFIQVKLMNTGPDALLEFNTALKKIPQIVECFVIAGDFDYLLKIRAKDIHDYRNILIEHIARLPFISSTASFITMESVID